MAPGTAPPHTAPPQPPGALRLRCETLRWVAGLYLLVLGAGLLLLPPSLFGGPDPAAQLRGAFSAASGMALLWLASTVTLRPAAGAVQVLVALPQLAFAVAYWREGQMPVAITLGLLALGLFFAALVPLATPSRGPAPDLLGLVFGGAQALQGLDYLLQPDAAAPPAMALGLPTGVLGAILLAGGLAVVLAQCLPRLPAPLRWAAHLGAGGTLLMIWAAIALRLDAANWLLGGPTLIRGLAIALLPWLSDRAARFDGWSLQARLALTLATAPLVPLLIVLPLALDRVERLAQVRALQAQQDDAQVAAGLIDEFVADQLAVLAAAATLPDLLDLPPAAQTERLRAVAATSPALLGLRTYDASGENLAASDTLPLRSMAGSPTFARLRETHAPIVEAAESAAPSNMALSLSVPVYAADGAFRGAIASPVATERIGTALTSAASQPPAAISLIDPHGQPLARLGEVDTITGVVGASEAAADGASEAAVGAALADERPGARLLTGRSVRFVGYAPVARQPWRVVVERPRALILADLDDTRRAVYGVVLLLIGGAALASWLLARRLAGPLRAIDAAVARIAAGQPGVKVPVGAVTELATLAASVNELASQLAARTAERDRALADEHAARLVAEAAVRSRDEFLSVAAHDLKNPLTTIKGFAQLLARQATRPPPPTPEQLVQRAAQIEAAAQGMTELIDELLDVSRLEAGHVLQLHRQPVDLCALVERLVGDYQATTERHTLVVEAAPPVIWGLWDAARLERVIRNLLSNALKYSPEGGAIRVCLSVEQEGAEAVLQVQDPGLGITPDDLPRVFERFFRGQAAESTIAGSGIGLAGAKQIVEQHGGTIGVASVYGQGATFTVRLPVAAADEA